MRQVPTWQAYERLAASERRDLASGCWQLLNETGEVALSPEAAKEGRFFQSTLDGRRSILDVGCGPGFPLILLAEHGAVVWGVDASPTMSRLARRHVAALGLRRVGVARALAEALPFANGSFDGFAMCGTLGSLPDPGPVLAELARVAARGALVADLEEDYRHRLAPGAPRLLRRLRRDQDKLVLQIVHYLVGPYRIRDERYVLDAESDLGKRLLADPALWEKGWAATGLLPERVPRDLVLDASYDIAAQFDPTTLCDAFGSAGFEVVEQRVEESYGVPHIFSVFRYRRP